MKENNPATGHLAAFVTIFVWGTTFISTKILLKTFTPVEILFLRFMLGYLVLWLVKPHFLRPGQKGQEKYFIAAGLCGVTLYYLLENVALMYTQASNVGVVISVAPFFTAIFSRLFLHGGRPSRRFYFGVVLAICGIFLISFSSEQALQLNPLGDVLALLAAVVWAVYAVITRKISEFGYHTVQTTRRTFFYGLIFMIPAVVLMDFRVTPDQLLDGSNLGNILFLGLGASAVCFVTWNLAVRKLGSVRTSVYIYLVPVITTVTSVIVLHEKITAAAAGGIGLTLAGLFLSESGHRVKKQI